MVPTLKNVLVAAVFVALLVPGVGETSNGEIEGPVSFSVRAGDTGEDTSITLYRPTHDRFNLHLGVGFLGMLTNNARDGQYKNAGVQGTVGFDVVLHEPIALSFQGGFNSFMAGSGNDTVTSAFVGAGLRMRLFASTRGALTDGGSAAGNLWLDAHFNYVNHLYEDHGGYDVGIGYEFALFKNINIGPYARFMHVAIGDGLRYITISGGLAISIAGETTPGDMDRDGVIDQLDACPTVPGLPEFDGCPNPDRDGDGIPNEEDECPDEPGLPEFNGCPDPDRDGDGIPNEEDECPDEPGLPEFNGCPDPDRDGDGIPNEEDDCPDEPGLPEFNGCPNPDRDGDGIPNEEDECPDEPGPADNAGCPRLVRVEGDQIKILEVIHFATGKAVILEKSFEMLNEVAAVIKAKPDIQVLVEGHTDNVGRENRNMKLSEDRAASVRQYLVDAGVEEHRLQATGFGPSRPIEDNKTEEGRASNRRVEFHIISLTATDESADETPETQPDGPAD